MVDTFEAFRERDPLWDDVSEYWECVFPYLEELRRWQHDKYILRNWFSWGDDSEPPSELKIDMDEAETVAEHTMECALFRTTTLFNQLNKPRFIDRDRTRAMLYIHDAGEVYAGEITVFQGKDEDFKKVERMCFVQILCETGCFTERLLALYDEYENEESIEALFAKFIDRYQGNLYFYQHQREFTRSMLDVSEKRIDDIYQKICRKVGEMEIEAGVRNEFLRELDTIVKRLNVVPYFAHAKIVDEV